MAATLTVELFVSVDGWAGSDGLPGYFGFLGVELEAWIAEQNTSPHVALLGRRTYDVLASIPIEAHGPDWAAIEKVVFSRTLREASWPNTRVTSRELVDEVAELKQGDTEVRTVGSLSLARQLLDATLADRVRLMTFPLLAGTDGREAPFAGVTAAELDLVDHRVLDGRLLLIEYRPTGRDVPRS